MHTMHVRLETTSLFVVLGLILAGRVRLSSKFDLIFTTGMFTIRHRSQLSFMVWLDKTLTIFLLVTNISNQNSSQIIQRYIHFYTAHAFSRHCLPWQSMLFQLNVEILNMDFSLNYF